MVLEYSLLAREAEADRLPMARRLGIGIVAAAPLGRGLLTGRVPPAGRSAGLGDALRRLQELASEMDVGAARLALAWLLARGLDVVPVPSTRDRVHLEMNMLALDVALSNKVDKALSEAFPPGIGAG
jgi:aryl-alcohol dehydrogenase-like predicted oxidoreductase